MPNLLPSGPSLRPLRFPLLFVLFFLSLPLLPFPLLAQRGALTPRQVAAQAEPAVVVIHLLDEEGRERGNGSGFFVHSEGVIATNFHVLEPASRLRVTLHDGRKTEEVFLLGADSEHDVALLQVPMRIERPLPLTDDQQAAMGDPVYVMGNPLGMEWTFSDGLVSARRTLQNVPFLQISAPISPGSSGGPVMNARGQVIGIATLYSQAGQNLNLAIPSRYVSALLSRVGAPRPFSPSLLASLATGPLPLRRPEASTAPKAAEPQDSWQTQVKSWLLERAQPLLEAGYRLHDQVQTGELKGDEIDLFQLYLSEGTPYAILAVCDEDCTDVDLAMGTESEVLAEDTRNDDQPYLLHVPARTGNYRLGVRMALCHSEPCHYALAVLTRP